jgi:hypothetical protein
MMLSSMVLLPMMLFLISMCCFRCYVVCALPLTIAPSPAKKAACLLCFSVAAYVDTVVPVMVSVLLLFLPPSSVAFC